MHRLRSAAIPVLVLVFLFSNGASAAIFDHRLWGELLQSYVRVTADGHASRVDYRGMQADHQKLSGYLQGLSTVTEAEFAAWPDNEQLAFLINVYNSWTVELILTGYPELQSIKDLGSLFSSPWKKKFVHLFGREMSLDDIEHGLIRGSGKFNEPRIHFVVNCASIGCPALRSEPYRGEVLESQLEDATRSFLADRTRNRLSGNRLEVSSIFKWYREDFSGGWRGINSLQDFFVHYRSALSLNDEEVKNLASDRVAIEFLPYDWSLNGIL